jgi:hypothetical protein
MGNRPVKPMSHVALGPGPALAPDARGLPSSRVCATIVVMPRWLYLGCLLAYGCSVERYDWAFYDANGAATTLQPNAMFVVGVPNKIGASMHRFDNYWFAPENLAVFADTTSTVQIAIGAPFTCQCGNNGISGQATEVQITVTAVGSNRLVFTTSDTDVITRWPIIGVSP